MFSGFLCLAFDSVFLKPIFQCQTLNEEEIFEVQDNLSLFSLGWIHVSLVFGQIGNKFYSIDTL